MDQELPSLSLTRLLARSEALAVHFDTTEIVQGDTALTPDQGYTAGSKTIQQGGARLRVAAATARAARRSRSAVGICSAGAKAGRG